MEQSHNNNPQKGITGILCFTDSLFVQMIEGSRDSVGDLFSNIVRDERHHHIRLLVYNEIVQRRFGNWTMGRVNMGKINPGVLLRYSDTADFNPFSTSGPATLAMLDELIASGSIDGRG